MQVRDEVGRSVGRMSRELDAIEVQKSFDSVLHSGSALDTGGVEPA